ncbi:hypothetical protein HETIRDRAFT_329809 [Heterobasidion irregulare TC 32-1]|uniref:RNA ligase/cyclic nucleotide phosphodiesterase n=1 Tax=Heterobasidion irregulare (strain TC 32-1) TaxID=747525 RepID=W4JRT9_HETIT|nr:uncharacterized protein HETIRDRAFT_329809 [Heterobasidion irregulare TC 32-1]ETW75800.1 hypothetical protein HETIRDRAFT_329809 [Heterobasidion irregulare TC 32-1]
MRQQRTKLLSPAFSGMTIDPVLRSLVTEPDFQDTRHGLVFSARLPTAIRKLTGHIQQKLKAAAPCLWLVPAEYLHMTVLEVTHSQTPETVAHLAHAMREIIPRITDFTVTHHARVLKPMLSCDSTAVSLSFIPAACEGLTVESSRTAEEDAYTFLHLRKDLYELSLESGIVPEARYVVPTAHFTIARIIADTDFETEVGSPDQTKIAKWMQTIEEVNTWLESNYWPGPGNEFQNGGVWVLGEDFGLDCRAGLVWYGGGTTLRQGKCS